MTDTFQRIIEKIYPGARLIGAKKLEGGVSAQVFALETLLPDATRKKLVVRQYGKANLVADPHAAAHEFVLLRTLKSNGLPVPAPVYADESREILPDPYIVVEFIDGETVEEPADVTDFVRRMAGVLANIHRIDVPEELSFLIDQQLAFTKKLARKPERLDESLSEGRIRSTLEEHWPPKQQNASAVLHGDFWPGNTMWSDGRLVGVIDWEDAASGDPLADLANGRLEILMFFGADAMDQFTDRYKFLMPHLSYANLPYWDLCAALRPAGKMAGWGLDGMTLRKLQTGHKQFVEQAIKEITI